MSGQPATPHKLSNNLVDLEFCPNCGNFVEQLNDKSGWCYECDPQYLTALSKVEHELENHADAIQFYMGGRINGKTLASSVWSALQLARSDRPTCAVCGERIRRSKRNAIFCRQHPECRRISRRYVYLYTNKGLSKVAALAQILTELNKD